MRGSIPMRWLPRTSLGLAAALVVGAGCGSSDPSPPVESGPSPGDQASATIERYYRALDKEQFKRAWKVLGRQPRQEFGGYEEWVAGYETTKEQKLRAMKVLSSNDSNVTAQVRLRVVDEDACSGETVVSRYQGTWNLRSSPRPDRWKAIAVSMTKTKGDDVLTSDECAPVEMACGQVPSAIEGVSLTVYAKGLDCGIAMSYANQLLAGEGLPSPWSCPGASGISCHNTQTGATLRLDDNQQPGEQYCPPGQVAVGDDACAPAE